MVINKAKKKVKLTGRKKSERKLEKEILGVLGFMALLLIVFVVAGAIFKSFNTFEYDGLTFTKERLGSIPIFHHFYLFNKDGQVVKYNLYLRHDPRLNNISVTGDKINLGSKDLVTFITIIPGEFNQCQMGALAVGSLASFITDNGFTAKGGSLDFWGAGLKKLEWVTCENRPGNRVIEIRESNETKIEIDGNCYKISVASCEILQATEKFKVQTIVDARERSQESSVDVV